MFPKLFSPVRIGGLEIKNRVAMTAMGVNLAAAGGGVNDDIIAFYEARARGGVGLIVSGLCRVMDGAGAAEPCQLASRNLADVQGLARLMDTVHKYGARMFIQLHHPGREGSVRVGGEQPVSASAVVNPITGEAPRALTVAEIGKIQEAFVKGACLAQMAGVDGVELHGAHGYLINSFLSPYLNRRDDDYGGNFENRLRFLMEILAGIRSACGKGFPLGVRLSAEEFLGDRGNDLAASCRIAAELEKAGVDFLDISSTIPDSPKFTACIEPGTIEQGWKKYMAAEIKKHVRIPIIAVANIKEPAVAEAILAEGCCDLVGVARGHLADPEWCKKAKAGKTETIRKCIGCLVCFDEIDARTARQVLGEPDHWPRTRVRQPRPRRRGAHGGGGGRRPRGGHGRHGPAGTRLPRRAVRTISEARRFAERGRQGLRQGENHSVRRFHDRAGGGKRCRAAPRGGGDGGESRGPLPLRRVHRVRRAAVHTAGPRDRREKRRHRGRRARGAGGGQRRLRDHRFGYDGPRDGGGGDAGRAQDEPRGHAAADRRWREHHRDPRHQGAHGVLRSSLFAGAPAAEGHCGGSRARMYGKRRVRVRRG